MGTEVIAPGSTIGILGGGQLGRMTAMAAARLGYASIILAPDADCIAADVAKGHIRADYDDDAALVEFAALADVVTIEFENVPAATLEQLAASRPVRPGANVLRVTQDRHAEKRFVQALGINTAPFAAIDSAEDLARAIEEIGADAILKTRRMGYDGKGQQRLLPGSGLDVAWAAIGHQPAILEAVVDFALEVSVITARAPDGGVVSYPPVENRHKNHILDITIAPADLPEALAEEAVRMAESIAERLDLVGLIAVEMFVTRDGEVLVNEMAPRPHNSGHWTLDASAVSQFEQLVRAICGLPLGRPEAGERACMQNLIGDDVQAWSDHLADPGARLHIYGKRAARPGRKMGHVTWPG